MFLDAQLLFSDAQAVTAAAASTNVVDLCDLSREIGTGRPLYVWLNVDVAMTDSSSDSTVTVTLESDAADTFGSAATVQTLFTIPAVSAIGYKAVAVVQPESIASTENYIRLYYTPNNGNLSTGSFTAALVMDPQLDAVYPDNITIS